jgi:gas vesicle protein
MTKPRDVDAGASPDDRKQTRITSRAGLLLVGLAGSIAGAAAALLLAPWRGAETRRRLKEAAVAAGTGAKEKALSLKEKVSGLQRAGEDEEADSDARDD